MPEILVVDDDANILHVVEFALKKAGFTVQCARNGRAALEMVRSVSPDLVVLDVLMPELDGLEVCRQIRAHSDLPIIFLTSVDEELDRVLGLELGADDYVTKPFSPRELVARVRTVLRRTEKSPSKPTTHEPLIHGALSIDSVRMLVCANGTAVELTTAEIGLLRALAAWPGKVYSRFELMDQTDGDSTVVSDRTIDSRIKRIRKKFESSGFDPIETVHGAGYRLGRFEAPAK